MQSLALCLISILSHAIAQAHAYRWGHLSSTACQESLLESRHTAMRLPISSNPLGRSVSRSATMPTAYHWRAQSKAGGAAAFDGSDAASLRAPSCSAGATVPAVKLSGGFAPRVFLMANNQICVVLVTGVVGLPGSAAQRQ